LIPYAITAVKPAAGGIRINTNADGRITDIWDGNGNKIHYAYEEHATPTVMDANSKEYMLTSVTAADAGVTQYSWNITSQRDICTPAAAPMDPANPTRDNPWYYFVDLASVTDPNNHSYGFTYEFDFSRKDWNSTYGYFSQFPCPRNVVEVSLPEGQNRKSQLQNLSDVRLIYASGVPTMFGQRQSRIVDAVGNATRYSFGSSKVVTLNTSGSGGMSLPKLFCYQSMNVTYEALQANPPNTFVTVGHETFEFDIEAGMALKSTLDFNGKLTQFIHGDLFAAPVPYRQLFNLINFNIRHSEVTRQVNAIGNNKNFTYTNDILRLPLSVTNEVGDVTTYVREPGLEGSPGNGRVLSETRSGPRGGSLKTSYEYLDPNVPGLPTLKTIEKLPGDNSVPSSLQTSFHYLTSGRVDVETIDPEGDGIEISYSYDASGNRLSTSDADGNLTAFHYDARHRLKKVVYPGLSFREIGYDLRGNKVSETDENGDVTTFGYDAANRLEWTKLDKSTTRFEYNAVGSRTAIVDPRGKRTEKTYDALQRLVDVKDPLNRHTTYEYGVDCGSSVFDSGGFKPTAIVDPRGYRVETEYDSLYRPKKVKTQYKKTPAVFSVSERVYDDVGLVSIERDPLLRETSYEYDSLGRQTKVTFADTKFRQTFYSSTGLPWKVVDERGNETITEYDTVGRVFKVIGPAVEGGRSITENGYDSRGNVTSIKDPRGKVTSHFYDSRNRKVKTIQPSVIASGHTPIWKYGYDAVGRQVAVIDPRNNVTYTGYDAFGRKCFQQNAAGDLHQWAYDLNGKVIKETDELGRITRNSYDDLNRLVETIDPMGIKVASEYDEVGNLTKVTDGKGQATTMEYDGMNRLTKTIDPASKATVFVYDGMNKISRTDSKGVVTEYFYDSRNRLHWDYHGGSTNTREFLYDDSGNLLTVSQQVPGGGGILNVAYTYDAANRLITETSAGYTHTYHYDLAGNRTSIDYGGSGIVQTNIYDELNRLQSISEGGRPTTYEYDAAGNILTKTLPNGDQTVTEYDKLNRAKLITGTSTNAGALYSYALKYDPVGNLIESAETYAAGSSVLPRTLRMSYDRANRLVKEEQTGAIQRTTTHSYDNANNRTGTSVSDGATRSFTYNSLNQLIASTGPDGPVSYQYDDNGNRTSRNAVGANDLSYTYDRENRLVGVSGQHHGTNVNQVYAYDYRSRRVSRTEAGTQLTVVFSGGTSVMEMNGASMSAVFQRGNDFGGGVGGLLYTWRAGQGFTMAHANHRGDIVTRTSGGGALQWQAAYEAFGTRTQEHGSTAERQMANTKEEDPAGLLNEGIRYRDLETGTFLTRDPAGFVDGPNLYAYVRQNPWSKFDPEGLQAREELRTPEEELEAHFAPPPNCRPVGGGWYRSSFGTEFRPTGNGIQFRNPETGAVREVRGATSLNRPSPILTSPEQLQAWEGKFGRYEELSPARDRSKATVLEEFQERLSFEQRRAEHYQKLEQSAKEEREAAQAKADALRDMRAEGISVDPKTGEYRAGDGVVYEVPGSGTKSGRPYIGTTDNLEQRTRTGNDGRDRTQAKQVGSYPVGNREARREAEQGEIEDRGGIQNLDNRRNEIAKEKK
jgi:RHS repeat-associated protein